MEKTPLNKNYSQNVDEIETNMEKTWVLNPESPRPSKNEQSIAKWMLGVMIALSSVI